MRRKRLRYFSYHNDMNYGKVFVILHSESNE